TWHRARPVACVELPREDLSLREMGALRRRLEDYKGDPRSTLVLSGREASFLVREQFDLPAWLAIDGTEVRLEAQVPHGESDPEHVEAGACWAVRFRGRVEVDRGRAFVVPDGMSLGDLDLTWIVGGRKLELPRSVLSAPGPAAAELADHLVSMQIADGTMFVRLDDPTFIR
ncbi:MAG: hypothetical protein ABMB14_20135, partial [Myxococcota bacterium]